MRIWWVGSSGEGVEFNAGERIKTDDMLMLVHG